MLTRYHHRAAGSHGFGKPDRTRLRGIRTGLQDLTGSDQQIQHAYKVSGRDCSISRVRHIRPNLPTRYKVGVAGSHGLGITDRTCLRGIRTGLQDLTGSEHQIVYAYVSGRSCMISRVRNNKSNIPRRYQDELQDLTSSEHHIVHA